MERIPGQSFIFSREKEGGGKAESSTKPRARRAHLPSSSSSSPPSRPISLRFSSPTSALFPRLPLPTTLKMISLSLSQFQSLLDANAPSSTPSHPKPSDCDYDSVANPLGLKEYERNDPRYHSTCPGIHTFPATAGPENKYENSRPLPRILDHQLSARLSLLGRKEDRVPRKSLILCRGVG